VATDRVDTPTLPGRPLASIEAAGRVRFYVDGDSETYIEAPESIVVPVGSAE
jgi:hypothetical protein